MSFDDFSKIIQLVVSLVVAPLLYWIITTFRAFDKKLDDIAEKHAAFREEVPRIYLTKEDYRFGRRSTDKPE